MHILKQIFRIFLFFVALDIFSAIRLYHGCYMWPYTFLVVPLFYYVFLYKKEIYGKYRHVYPAVATFVAFLAILSTAQ